MSDAKGQDRNSRIELSRSSGERLELNKGAEGGMVRQSFSHGRSKPVAVEVKRRRGRKSSAPAAPVSAGGTTAAKVPAETARKRQEQTPGRGGRASGRPVVLKPLTEEEKRSRLRALHDARQAEDEARKKAEEAARQRADDEARRAAEEEAGAKRKAEEEARHKSEDEARKKAEDQATRLLAEEERKKAEDETAANAGAPAVDETPGEAQSAATAKPRAAREPQTRDDESRSGKAPGRPGRNDRPRGSRRVQPRRGGRIVLDSGGEVVERQGPSLAALRRQREREKQKHVVPQEPIVRDVVLPEAITVQELANRMAVRGVEVVKCLMRLGVMATINQTIDVETAELVIEEFGHKVKRAIEADVEIGLAGDDDPQGNMQPRAPVVTVMGHVDHGKTSLLDALRSADVATHEAGGITQHIGAYQVDVGDGHAVTFIDTPGHAAFTKMRARGASITDIVVLVVAADDGVMPQTVEAIDHAKAAKVPVVVAINKIDRPEADAAKLKNELLSHDIVVEDFGGDILAVEVSATERTGLDKLLEAIHLQSELLELHANPDREAQGALIEARLDRGRGVVATVLVQRGTLRIGDIVVCGAQWGRARALIDDHGRNIKEAGPSVPVEILGLDGVPVAGDQMVAVDSERRAREVVDYRRRVQREQQAVAAGPRSSLEDMMSRLQTGESSELPIVIKSDVHGSLEAIQGGLENLSTDEVRVRVLHGAVGGITESDVTLAQASGAIIVGFNVRANVQARDMAKQCGIEIRYYRIIYELLDEMKALLSGMLKPDSREVVLGHAEIREVFNITKIGRVAGCRVTDGLFKRSARARLLRDDIVQYDGALGSLKRFKDDVREVREGFECGMSIDGYNDIRQGDVIEAYEVEEVARSL